MQSLGKYINNPIVLSTKTESLERLQFVEERKINSLLKLNIRKLIKNKTNAEKIEIICINGRMFVKR